MLALFVKSGKVANRMMLVSGFLQKLRPAPGNDIPIKVFPTALVGCARQGFSIIGIVKQARERVRKLFFYLRIHQHSSFAQDLWNAASV